jgi:hypothetical protein
MKRLTTIFLLIAFFSLGTVSWGADLFPGYANSPWDTEIDTIMKTYPKGTLGKLQDQVIYKQLQPSKELRQRTFAFRDNKLVAVTVSFAPDFVSKTGVNHLMAIHQKTFGTGQLDRTNAPHLLSYVWENGKTKITFAYTPEKLDYTVLLFQQK